MTSPIGSWISPVLVQLGWASLVGAVALAVAWALGRFFTRLSAATRCWLWRLAFLKMMLATVLVGTLELPLLPTRSWEEVGESIPLREAKLAETTKTAPPPAPPAPLKGWQLALAALWTAGVALGVTRLFRAWRHARHVRLMATGADRSEALAILADVSKNMGLSKPPALAVLEDGAGPMLVGLRRPTILLPACLGARPPAELRSILAHEVAHLVRRDLAWNLMVSAAEVLFFFHPLVRLAVREMSLDQEVAADELALASTGESVKSYGELLLAFVQVDAAPRRAPLVAMHAGSSAQVLKRRLTLLARSPLTRVRSRRGLAALALLAVAVLVPFRLIRPDPSVTTTPVSMAIKQATVQVVVETIAINSGFIVVVAPEAANRLVSVNFRDVGALDALRQIARGSGLRIVEVPYVTTQPAFVLIPPLTPDPVRVFRSDSKAIASMAIKDASLVAVLETIAINMGANVVISPELELQNRKISIFLNDLIAPQALNLVADAANVQLIEEINANGEPTYIMRAR